MTVVLIVAAGKGTRMGPGMDKGFLELNGMPVVAHTWRTFDKASAIEEIIMVVRDGMQEEFEKLAERFSFKKKCRFVPGGKERQDSVWNGLEGLPSGSDIVAIQDAARPCTTMVLIEATIEAAKETGAAVA